ncbi:hypothetical protein SK224_16095 [Microbacterium sp. BG28]|uniref:hypothetical protein n=1 Tax=Microbacterium sp. BG28 TaxID=3097356 RepID=UPI002A5AE22E|nr:hypothetical protein [Microbacterium sp. BG28]MDY0830658.1 hypothetical protein [Microbacterium sp. BG28]
MTTPAPKAVIPGSAIASITLGALGLVAVLLLIPGLKVLGLLLAVAAVIVGVLGAVNARRSGGPSVASWIGVALGVTSVVYFVVWSLT